MKVIGVFREFGRNLSSSLPSLKGGVGALTDEMATKVVRYLESGVQVIDVMENVRDPLDPTFSIPGGSSLLSDGDWIWRYDLAYFVRKYRVGLPVEFLERVETNQFHSSSEAEVLCKTDAIWASYNAAERGGD